MVGVNICCCSLNWELQKLKLPPLVKYCRGKLLLLSLELEKFKLPPRVKYSRG